MTPEQVISLIQNIGIAGCILVGLIYVAYQLGKILIVKVLVPLVEAHVEFLHGLIASMKESTAVQKKIADSQTMLHQRLEEGVCDYVRQDQTGKQETGITRLGKV